MLTFFKTAVLSISCFILSVSAHADDNSLEGRNLLVMENQTSYLAIDLAGGTIADFHLKKQGLNPFSWNHPKSSDTAPRKMGHFICFDRWGAPTKAELDNGMPFHGEATTVNWVVEKQPVSENRKIISEISCHLPMAQLTMNRTIILDDRDAVVEIREIITNTGKLGRIYNLIQHGTFAAPFLSKKTIVDTDVARGFYQNGPKPGEPVIYWPNIAYGDKLVNLRKFDSVQGPGVLSFVFSNGCSLGWATACNPEQGLLVGYVWNVKDYPWLNMWRHFNENGPASFGIEFGTSGLHQPYPLLVKQHEIFGRKLYEYIDAGETSIKSYTLFLGEIPHNYSGVGELAGENGVITMKESKDGSGHTLNVHIR